MDTEFYASLLDQISDGVYFVDRDRVITYWNVGAERITGYPAAEVLGRSCSEGILRHVTATGHQLCLNGCPLAAVMTDGKPRQADVFLHHKDGYRVPVTVRGVAAHDQSEAITGCVEVFSTRSASQYAALDRRASHDDSLDPTTGLPIRRLGELHLATLSAAVRETATPLGVLFLDADHFKAVNDTHGHRTGDQVLRMVGQSLANGLRRGDVPIRWGGEEFLALLPGTDEKGLIASAERVRMLVANSWIQKGTEQVRITVSIGATMARPEDSADDLVDRADQYMYQAKTAGRNRITTETGTHTSHAESPILGSSIPWRT